MTARLLLAGVAASLVFTGLAQGQTRFEQDGACKIKITVPIEIFTAQPGDRPPPDAGDPPVDYPDRSTAAQQYAENLERQAERVWNGVSQNEAEILATTAGIQDFADTADVNIQRGDEEIRAEWARYANEFGVDPSCAYIPCCEISVDIDLRVRGHDDPQTAGYHQIGVMGPRFRSFVYKQRNPDLPADVPTDWSNPDHVVRGDRVQTSGFWANDGDTRFSAAAHEVGHLMGLGDEYRDVTDDAGETYSVSNHGHDHDLMASSNGFPFSSALEALRERAGFDCDCCPDRDELTPIMQDYALLVGDTGDMIAVCDQEGILRQLDRLRELRRRMALSNAHPRQKALAAAEIDYDIRRFERALVDCPRDRVITGTAGDPVDEALISVGVTTDSQTFCEYDTTGGENLPLTSTPRGGDDGDDGDDPRDTPVPPGGGDDDGDDPRDAPGDGDGSDPGDTPGDDGDDPRDSPGGDDPLNPGWIPGLDDDPTWLPGLPEPGGDDDDPRDTPSDGDDPGDTPTEDDDGDDPGDVTVPVFVKARADVLNSATGAVQSEETPGQVIRLNPPDTAAPALPGAGVERDDSGYDREPTQCVTDENGDCVIDMPVASLGSGANVLDAYYLDVQAVQRESATLVTGQPLTQEQQNALSDLAIEGDEIDVTGLSMGAEIDGYGYRLDWGLKAGYDLDTALSGMLGGLTYEVEENICRDKQPGPPLGWLHLPDMPDRGDLPAQTVSLSLLTQSPLQLRRSEAQP